jgi:hypothetical protein
VLGLTGAGDLFDRCSRSGNNNRRFCGAVMRAGGRTDEPGDLILAWAGAHLDIDSVRAVRLLS